MRLGSAAHWTVAVLSVLFGGLCVLETGPTAHREPASLARCRAADLAAVADREAKRTPDDDALLRATRQLGLGVKPGLATALATDPDKTINLIFTFSGGSTLEWNDALLNRLKIKIIPADERDAQQKDATTVEIEVALRSILSNLPPGGAGWAVKIYFVTDSAASERINRMLRVTGLNGSHWPVPITMEVIDVGKLVPAMRWVIQRSFAFRDYRTYHAFGQWFRFFLPWVLPNDVGHVIYIDPDVWFVSNLAAMWAERNDAYMLQWGAEAKCSGAMIFNLRMMREHFFSSNIKAACQFYHMSGQTPLNYDEVRDGRNGDQAVLRRLFKAEGGLFGNISKNYDIAIANGAWKFGNKIADAFPEAGTLHSNGGGPDNHMPYWLHEFYTGRGGPPKGWALVFHYVELPWAWMMARGEVLAKSTAYGGARMQIKPLVAREPTPAFLAGISRSHMGDRCEEACDAKEKVYKQRGEVSMFLHKASNVAACDACVCKGMGGLLNSGEIANTTEKEKDLLNKQAGSTIFKQQQHQLQMQRFENDKAGRGSKTDAELDGREARPS